jgi:hypothetical protein
MRIPDPDPSRTARSLATEHRVSPAFALNDDCIKTDGRRFGRRTGGYDPFYPLGIRRQQCEWYPQLCLVLR